jgi:hypothetical protein
MPDESRDLLGEEGEDNEYPAHIRIRNFRFEGTDLAASLWLGNENSAQECDALLTSDDVEWMITTLQGVLAEHRSG